MGDSELPVPWCTHPTETGYAQQIFDKYKKAETGELERPAFENIAGGILGTAAASRKKKEQRTMAWFSNKNSRDAVDFVKFLVVLTASGVVLKQVAQTYEELLDPSKKKAREGRVLCPYCKEELPRNYKAEKVKEGEEGEEEESEDKQLLKKLEELEKRRATINQEMKDQEEKRKSVAEQREGEESRRGSAEIHVVLDPRLSRLRADEIESLALALSKLNTLGFGEVDVPALLKSCRGAGAKSSKEEEPSANDSSDRFGTDTPGFAQTYSSPQRKDSLDVPDPHSETSKARPASPNPSPDRRQSAARKSVGDPRRKSAGGQRGSVAAQSRGSVSSQGPGRRKSLEASKAPPPVPKGPPAPPPPDAIPDAPLPEGCVKKEDLQQAIARRTEKLIESVRRMEAKMAKQWADGAELAIWVDNKCTLLHLALEQKKNHSIEIMRIVSNPHTLNARSDHGETPVHLAARLCMAEKVKVLKELGADVNLVDSRGYTALHTASLQPNGAGVVKVLLEAGADTGVKDSDGNTAMHHSATPEIVAEFLDRGVPMNAVGAKGNTPLHTLVARGVFVAHPEHDALARLCTAEALSVKNEDGDTPLHTAVLKDAIRVCDFMAHMGADVENTYNAHQLSATQLVRRKWQQEAGNTGQIDWSAVLMAFGGSTEKLQLKGSGWYQLEHYTWVPVEGEAAVCSIAEGLQEAGGKLQWAGGTESEWVSAVKAVLHGQWSSISVTTGGWKGQAGARLLVHCTTADGTDAKAEFRFLPHSAL
eukprot:Hpha_TRINITY_DN16297_c3_g7::TRINITY_DN16297_c3_g7_i1::g.15736::m.15736